MQITKPVVCQYCHELMDYVEKDDYWKCPNCTGEFWLLNTSAAEDKKAIEEAFENGYISRALPAGYRIPPGGSKKPGKRKEKLKPALMHERYKLI